MKHLRIGLTALIALASTALFAAQANDPALIKRGEYLARAADCFACHTADKTRPLAGGYGIDSPFGTIYTPNITPDKETGIGNWSDDEFYRALHNGIGKHGEQLYPAFPYRAFTLMPRDDVMAIKAYLFAQPPIHYTPPPTQLPFPFNQRWLMLGWKMFNFREGEFKPEPGKDETWNRGAYLVEGLAHCQECHTPRTLTMGLNADKAFGGGRIGNWHAFNISSDKTSGVGGWSDEELIQYLHTGKADGRAAAAGGMAEAVEDSLRYLSPEDLKAIVGYLRSVPPVHNPKDNQSRSTWGKAANDEVSLRGKAGITASNDASGGAELFSANCASCHNPSGAGSSDGYYPSLFHNSTVGAQNPANLALVLLNGVHRDMGNQTVFMPSFGDKLTDAQIATLTNYLLERFGNPARTVDAHFVKRLHHPGKGSTYLIVAIAAFAVVVLAIIASLWAIRRRPLRVLHH
ncbi:cytochrome c [Amantichitinum ursilacus]|uniref:Fructose dehydrogenase cytochrome subunit n=1 Tax=Amantichitinum ursilacus TaxID=857265 RepID=A0A0N0GLG7_9NEIS|nr:cytochrome c [Amantichitinum ursilacus]KPC49873.1 Fructose dehydrogenase cytochrome subunit precursor [Amantichitinum ursilacus]